MRHHLILLAVLIASSADAEKGDLPLMAIGMRFAPEIPKPVAPTHPLYHDIAFLEIDDLPPTIKSSSLNFIAAAKRSSVNAGLRETLERMNMLAPDAATAHKRLSVTWVGSHTPFHIGANNQATATFHYRLARVDNGQILFDREITTAMTGGGAGASMRNNGIVRGAIAANFASAANCLDRAAYGTAPADCALTPLFRVRVFIKQR